MSSLILYSVAYSATFVSFLINIWCSFLKMSTVFPKQSHQLLSYSCCEKVYLMSNINQLNCNLRSLVLLQFPRDMENASFIFSTSCYINLHLSSVFWINLCHFLFLEFRWPMCCLGAFSVGPYLSLDRIAKAGVWLSLGEMYHVDSITFPFKEHNTVAVIPNTVRSCCCRLNYVDLFCQDSYSRK